MADEKKSAEKPAEPKPLVIDNPMYDTEQVAPDGHKNLTKEDIEARA